MKSTPGVRSDLFTRPLDKALLTDFFGGVSQAEVVAEGTIDSHARSAVTEKALHPNAGEQKPKALKPSAVKADAPEGPSLKGDGIPSAMIRAWAGASLIGLFVAGITISASRPL
jgi:phosphatidylinositol glycan class K